MIFILFYRRFVLLTVQNYGKKTTRIVTVI